MTSQENSQEPRRIAIVGSGAVGGYYGARLAQHGREVHFLMRSDYQHVHQHGLKILSHLGSFDLPQVHCHREPEDIGPCDLVIIAMKTTANAALPAIIAPLLHDDTLLLTLQNGLGNEEFLASHFGAQRVLGGLCFVCINRTAPGVIEHLAQGQIAMGEFIGAPQPRTHAIAEMLRESQIDCTVEPSLMAARWRKLVWNIPFNGLSIAGGGLDTERILSDKELSALVRILMDEVIAAASVLGHDLPSTLPERMIHQTRTMEAYKTSSLIDYLEGREVELESIWGEPLRQAVAAGAAMPELHKLYHKLKALLAASRKSP